MHPIQRNPIQAGQDGSGSSAASFWRSMTRNFVLGALFLGGCFTIPSAADLARMSAVPRTNNRPVDDQLIAAAWRGDLAGVKQALSQGGSVRARDKWGLDALSLAAGEWGGDYAAIRQALVDAGADVNARGQAGTTPIFKAAASGSVEGVKWLIDHKADLTARIETGQDLLSFAATGTGKVEIVKALIDAGMNVNAVDSNIKMSALMWAVKEIKTPRERAQMIETMRPMVPAGLPWLSQTEKDFSTQAEIVKLLLKSGADVKVKDVVNNSAIIYAGESPDPEIARALIAAGANPSDKNIANRTGLINAAMKGNTETARVFVDAGCDLNVDEIYKSGGTALMFAAAAGHDEIVRLLIDKKADLNKVHTDVEVNQSYDRWAKTTTTTVSLLTFTALQIARAKNDPKITAMLLQAGANR